MLRPPLYVFLLQRPAVLREGLVRLLPHLLELVLLHPLKQLAHILLARFQLHPLRREGERDERTSKLWISIQCTCITIYVYTNTAHTHTHTHTRQRSTPLFILHGKLAFLNAQLHPKEMLLKTFVTGGLLLHCF